MFKGKWLILLLLFVLSFLPFQLCSAYAEKVVVITNKANTQGIDSTTIKNIYSDNIITWDNGKKIRLFELPVKSPVREIFARQILGISAKESAKEWANRKITNTVKNAPRTKKAKFIANMVAKDENAIGYIPESLAAGKDGIKVVLTIE